MMRIVALIGLISFLCFSCDKLDDLTKFNLNYESSVTVPSTTLLDSPFSLSTPEINSDTESTFSNNNTRKDMIEEIYLTNMVLEITSPTEGNFDFLNKITIYIDADGLDEIQIASMDNIPEDGLTTLTLETSDMDLKEYIKKDQFQLRVNTTTDKTIQKSHDIKINSVFHVNAKVLGV